MNSAELNQQLASEGLRIASDDEPGWTYTYINEDGERVTVWTTDIEPQYNAEDVDYLLAVYTSPY